MLRANNLANFISIGAGHIVDSLLSDKFAIDKYVSVRSYMSMINQESSNCACPDCRCEVSDGNRVASDGKEFCSEACANGHASGAGCCENSCQCQG